jgi:hypothetical protein
MGSEGIGQEAGPVRGVEGDTGNNLTISMLELGVQDIEAVTQWDLAWRGVNCGAALDTAVQWCRPWVVGDWEKTERTGQCTDYRPQITM